MKTLIMVMMLAGTACLLNAQDVTVRGKTKVNTDFSKYKTFAWAESDLTAQAEGGYDIYTYTEEVELKKPKKARSKKEAKTKANAKPERYIYSYNVIIPSSVASVNDAVKHSISDELESRGYRESQSSPDLLVTYRVLERQARMKGYLNDDPTMVGSTEVRQPSDTTTYTLEPGTLLISLIDSKSGEVVWDGFASGLSENNAFITNDSKIKESVHLVMEKFEYRGDAVKVDN
jgi:hypothetical protein